MDTREKDVDSQLIKSDRHGGERGNGVHHHENSLEGLDHFYDFPERIQNTGGGFVVNEGDGVKTAFGQFCANRFRVDRLAPFDLNLFRFHSAALGHAEPFIGKGPAAKIENLGFHEVSNAPLHHAPGGRGGKEDRAGSPDDLADPGLDGSIKIFEVGTAVADGGAGHGGVGFRSNIDGTWDEELGLGHRGRKLPSATGPV